MRRPSATHILAIDQSTSATKTMLFNRRGKLVDRISLAHRAYYPSPGFVEHDPGEIFRNTLSGMEKILAKNEVGPAELAGIAITNQRETAMIWDRNTGEPVTRAAVWQCQRGAEYCAELKEKGYSGMIAEKTGLLIDPYFSASKLHWIMRSYPDLAGKAEKGELLLGTMDSWLLWKLTGGKIHATDYSNACRTMLFNIKTLLWDEELMELFGLHPIMFPEVKFSDEIFGTTDPGILFDLPVPIAGLMGDSHAALVGQQCFMPGMGKATYGTGSSVMIHTGTDPGVPPKGLVTSIGYGMQKKIQYVSEGNIHSTGDTINWLIHELELIISADEAEVLATSVEDNQEVYLVPAFTGLGAPYWDHSARACLSGMSRNTTRAHVARAALESIAYQIRALIQQMETQGNTLLKELRVDGGPTRNNFLMQFQADILGRKVICSGIEEISALGASYLAGLATGFWKDPEEIRDLKEPGRVYEPAMDREKANMLYDGWTRAVERARL